MRKLRILLLFIVLFTLSSCGPNPGKFNDNLIENLNKADREYTTFYALADQYSDNDNFIIVTEKGKVTIKEMEELIKQINKYNTPKEGDDFKNLTVEYIKNMVNSVKGFTQDEKLTKDQFDKALENMDKNEVKLNEIDNKIIEAQKSFASKRGFELKGVSSKK